MTDRGRRLGKGIAIALAVHIVAAALLGILGYRFTQRPPQILEVTLGGGGGGGGKGSAAAEKGTAETAASAAVQQQKQQELEQIIAEEKLKPAEAQRFVSNAFRDGALKTTGTDIDQILPPVSRFGGARKRRKRSSKGLRNFLKNTSEFSAFTPTCIPVHFGVYCK